MPYHTRNGALELKETLHRLILVLKFILRLLKANLKLGGKKPCLVASFDTNLAALLKYIHGASSEAGLHRLSKPRQVLQGNQMKCWIWLSFPLSFTYEKQKAKFGGCKPQGTNMKG